MLVGGVSVDERLLRELVRVAPRRLRAGWIRRCSTGRKSSGSRFPNGKRSSLPSKTHPPASRNSAAFCSTSSSGADAKASGSAPHREDPAGHAAIDPRRGLARTDGSCRLDNDILEPEEWKRKLMTREFGLKGDRVAGNLEGAVEVQWQDAHSDRRDRPLGTG